MSRARLRLTGVSSFTAQMVGYLVGVLFIIMVARRLSETEFGAWSYIGTLVMYFILPLSFFSGWMSRDAARGKKVLWTALIFSLPLLIASTTSYFLLSEWTAGLVNMSREVLLLGLLQLLPLFLVQLSTHLAYGYVPQRVGIGVIIFELSKLVLCLHLVVNMRMGLLGVFLALAVAHSLQFAFLTYSLRGLFSRWIDRGAMGRWLKGSPFIALGVLGGYVSSMDIVLMSVVTRSTLIAGYWQAAVTAGLLVYSASNLIGGLYQRLLSGGSQADVNKSFHFTLVFAIPMVLGVSLLAGDVLWILKPSYSTVWSAAVFLALSYFVRVLCNFPSIILAGTDKFDVSETASFRDFALSRVFLITKIGFFTALIYALFVWLVMMLSMRLLLTLTETVTMLTVLHLFISLTTFILLYSYMCRLSAIRIPLGGMRGYFIAGFLMLIVVYALRVFIDPRSESAFEAVIKLAPLALSGAMVYFAILWLIERDFRILVRDLKAYISSMY